MRSSPREVVGNMELMFGEGPWLIILDCSDNVRILGNVEPERAAYLLRRALDGVKAGPIADITESEPEWRGL